MGSKVVFTTYEFMNRPLVMGEAGATFSSLNPNVAAAFESTTANFVSRNHYDNKPSSAVYPWSLFANQVNGATITNLVGRLAATSYRSGGKGQIVLYSYDSEGNLDKKYIISEGDSGVNTAVSSTLSYKYDLQGNLKEQTTLVGSSYYYHWYDYDNVARLWKNSWARPARSRLRQT